MNAKRRRHSRITALPLQPRLLRGRVSMTLIVAVAMVLSACVTPPGGTYDPSVSTTGVEGAEPGTPATAPTEDYRIGPEDLLSISVWKEPDLQRDVRVRPDGGISFPLAGDVNVAGKTPEQVTGIITERVQKYIPAAVVTVSVVEVAGYNVFVIGQVNTPGKFVLGRYVDVMQALTLAGGMTPFADTDDITIRRRVGSREIVFPFDYGAVQSGDNTQQNIVLQSGDVVVVP
jgi:polysaccharide export outer membrane protein